MHYKNGRPANNGEKVLFLPTWGAPVVGILYDAVAENDHCNGKLAPCSPNDPCPDLKNCLHIEDVTAVNESVTLKSYLEAAWGIIANANGGDWDKATPEWRAAAEEFRGHYHSLIPKV